MQALKGNEITVYGDGSQTRSFCFVSDTMRGLLLALTEKNARGEFINIGNPNEITILQLAKTIKKITNSSSEIVFKKLPEDDPRRRCPDITKAKKILGWEPVINLESGTIMSIEWFKKFKK
jgi:nucleoside-diphosphate-sugar epimerase